MNALHDAPAITGLHRLQDKLAQFERTITKEEAARLLEESLVKAQDVASYVSFDSALYRRGSVVRTEHYELLVVCWGPGQRSTIHDHAQSICAFQIVQGVGTEFHFERSSGGHLYPSETSRHQPGDIQSCEGLDAHQLCNLETEGLVSLHLYSPPLANCHTYSLEETPFGGYAELTAKVARRASGQVSQSHRFQPLGDIVANLSEDLDQAPMAFYGGGMVKIDAD